MPSEICTTYNCSPNFVCTLWSGWIGSTLIWRQEIRLYGMDVGRCWSYMDGSHIIYAMIRTGTIVIGMAAYANSCHIGCVSWIHPEEVASLISLQHHWTILLRWFD